jgi:drug/metabolite transporter (DMT)-like permease
VLLGELFAGAAALGFALASFYFRIGQRDRPTDDGVLTGNVVNLAINLPLALVLGLLGKLPPLNWVGVGLFVLGGVLSAFLGRTTWTRSIRLIGPSRATALEGTYPLVTAALAVAFLSERLPPGGWFGACLAIGGVLLLGWDSPAPAKGRGRSDKELLGLLVGICSSVSFGVGAVVRKLALGVLPSPFVGAPINSGTAVAGSILVELVRGRGWTRVREALFHPPPGFVIAGAITAAAQLANLTAVYLAPVSRVSLINAGQPVLAVILAAVLFRRQDVINWRVAIAAGAIVLGVILVTVA